MQFRFILQEIFKKTAEGTHFSDPLERLLCDEEVLLCAHFDYSQIQDSWMWRNTHVARELAKLLIDEKGNLNQNQVLKALQILEANMFSLGSERHHDSFMRKHLLEILHALHRDKDFAIAFKKIKKPTGHIGAEKLIRETLVLPDKIPLTDVHTKQAVLSALLTSLRQNVGSCFATAPAILIQRDQPLNFVTDMYQLLSTGRLTRVYEGIEYVVPLSLSWGVGDLLRPILVSSLGEDPLKTLSFSPGLQAAFESADLINQQLSHEEKRKETEGLLKNFRLMHQGLDSFALISADQILRGVLLFSFGITEEDVKHYHEIPLQTPLGDVLIQHPAGHGKKTAACRRYLQVYEKAKLAFKGLADNALLKAWEFTLASLSESKTDFAKWNLYASLGVNPEEPHGIGASLFAVIQQKIQDLNEEIKEFQSRYDHLFAQAKYLEGRAQRAASDTEMGWIQAEYQIRRQEINRALSEQNAAYDKGRKLEGLYPFLIEFYGKKIKDYFQEVYDAEMHDVSANPYDDSPAGFRLMYKHGRANTAMWTMIYSAIEYIQHLTSFFISTEIDLLQEPQVEGLQQEIAELITTAILTIKRPEFLESSIYRLAKIYGEAVIANPLENLDKVTRKPWSYVSGGTMSTLVSSYWGKALPLKQTKRWVESETELLAFFIDAMKELHPNEQQKFRKNPERNMLAYSPTHAFLLKPGWDLFREGWESDVYTYTWIKDHWMSMQRKFLDEILLDAQMMSYLIQKLLSFFPHGYRGIVGQIFNNFAGVMTPPQFRHSVLKALSYEKWLGKTRLELVAEELDSLLFSSLPLFPDHALRKNLITLFDAIGLDSTQKETLASLIEQVEERVGKYTLISASELRDVAKGLLIAAFKQTRTSIDFHESITNAMRTQGLCIPKPLLFADTNWVKNVFGFTVNPGTGNLGFWRFDVYGGEGRPITAWKQYLDGSNKEDWGVYTEPNEYV